MASSNTEAASIPLVYRLFCLYIEPVFALGGTYLTYFQSTWFIKATTPTIIGTTSTVISPLEKLLLTNISGLYAFLAVNEALVLRFSHDLKLWRAVEFSLCLSDIAHGWSFYEASPKEFFDILHWRQDDWMTLGTLWVGFFIRIAIVLGIGFGSRPTKNGKQH